MAGGRAELLAPLVRFYGDIPGEYGSAITTYDVDLTSNSWVLAIDQAAYNNCYFYGDYDGYAPEFDAVVAGYFGKRIPIIVAAGNERNDGDCAIAARSGYASVPPPGTAKNVITVGAINTNNSSMTTFSGYGPVDDGRVKPDLVAGGCQSSYNYSIWSTWPGDTYGAAYYCGTSMATPAVSGAVALLIESWGAGGDGPWPSTLKALLLGTADDLGNPGPDYRFGYGGMNVKRAVDRIGFATVIEDSVGHGGVREWTFPVPAGFAELKVTLVWDDPAGTRPGESGTGERSRSPARSADGAHRVPVRTRSGESGRIGDDRRRSPEQRGTGGRPVTGRRHMDGPCHGRKRAGRSEPDILDRRYRHDAAGHARFPPKRPP